MRRRRGGHERAGQTDLREVATAVEEGGDLDPVRRLDGSGPAGAGFLAVLGDHREVLGEETLVRMPGR
ncbi:MAG TPA: hypothetical protein VFY17_05255 [Pilimelia sp.]|nr:hypothetical protein [Pilimelia sp.]